MPVGEGEKKKRMHNLMNPTCGAKTKGSGNPCKRYPCKNGRCRLHGGKSTGPRTMEGKERHAKAITKHGRYSKKAVEERRRMRQVIKDAKDLIGQVY